MTYKEQLLDPRWQKKRLLVLERDNWACQYCGNTTETLMVHHLLYDNKYAWEADDDTLLTLCGKCHTEFHDTFSVYEKIILKKLRKKLKDPFIIKCAAELFTDVDNLNDLVYCLWELRQKEKDILDSLKCIPSDYNF